MDMGAVYFKICFWQLDFKVVNDRAVFVGYDVERKLVQRKARSLVETHLLDIGIEAVLVECLHRNFSTHIADVDMLGVELSGGDGCILHIVTEITAAYQDRVETQVDIGLLFYGVFAGESIDDELQVQLICRRFLMQVDGETEQADCREHDPAV